MLCEQTNAFAQMTVIQRFQQGTVDEVAGVELGRRCRKPAEVSGFGRLVATHDALAGTAVQRRLIAERNGVAPVVENLEERDWPLGDVHFAAELLAGADRNAMLDLLSMADNAARDVPTSPERIAAPGEQHALPFVLDQQVHIDPAILSGC